MVRSHHQAECCRPDCVVLWSCKHSEWNTSEKKRRRRRRRRRSRERDDTTAAAPSAIDKLLLQTNLAGKKWQTRWNFFREGIFSEVFVEIGGFFNRSSTPTNFHRTSQMRPINEIRQHFKRMPKNHEVIPTHTPTNLDPHAHMFLSKKVGVLSFFGCCFCRQEDSLSWQNKVSFFFLQLKSQRNNVAEPILPITKNKKQKLQKKHVILPTLHNN